MTKEEKSYVFGLLMSDGNLYFNRNNPNKGKVSLEVSERDRDIIEKLYFMIPKSTITSRTRNTNFKKNCSFVSFHNSQKQFRDELVSDGFPVSDKTSLAGIPKFDYSERDFWRGIIDGDGSLGYANSLKKPFLSLVTKSETLKVEYCKFLSKLGMDVNPKRNKRDDVYNLCLLGENSIKVAKILYEDCCCCLNRKFLKYLEIVKWKRPENMRKLEKSSQWSLEEIEFLLTHHYSEMSQLNGKTEKQILSKISNLNFRGLPIGFDLNLLKNERIKKYNENSQNRLFQSERF